MLVKKAPPVLAPALHCAYYPHGYPTNTCPHYATTSPAALLLLPPPRAPHSAACCLWPRGLSAGVSPAGPLRRTRVCFTLLSLRKMVSLDATTTSGYNQMVRCDLITCVLVRAARHDRRPLARRPSSQRARRMTGSVQRHFRDGRKASTGARRETQEGQDTPTRGTRVTCQRPKSSDQK